jgi:hypothetical protein
LTKGPAFPISSVSLQCPACGVLAFPLHASILNSFAKLYPLNAVYDKKRLSNVRQRRIFYIGVIEALYEERIDHGREYQLDQGSIRKNVMQRNPFWKSDISAAAQ